MVGLAILTGKTEKHYEFAFNILKNNIDNYKVRAGIFYPTYIHIDKELAILNAIKKIFPQTKIRLCYFHFSNNINKRINNNIFKDLFESNIISLHCVFGCKALAFIPTIYIIPVFELLVVKAKSLNNPNLDNFLDYFSKEWIYGTDNVYWNYYNDFQIKTNNASESYNNKINKIFNNKKPFLYHALFEYRVLINESYEHYQENIINHGAEEVNKDPLRSKIKNILDKYDMDYIKLRQENESDDIDMESDVYYDDNGLYEIYTRLWYNCVLSLSEVIRNIDFE